MMDPNSVPATPTLPPGLKSNNLGIILGAVSLIVVFGLGGYFVGRASSPKIIPTIAPSVKTESSLNNPIFLNQKATIEGEITKINGPIISIKNKNGQIGDFPLLPKILISKINVDIRQATSSSDIKDLETGKLANITLLLVDNKYQISSLAFFEGSPSATISQ